jgi:hypothetical protein
VYQHNLQAEFKTTLENINLKGIIVVNGATHWDYDCSPSFPQTVYNFNLITKDLFDTYEGNNCFVSFNGVLHENMTVICNDTWNKINALTSGLNWYDLYRKVYPGGLILKDSAAPNSRIGEVEIDGEIKKYKRGMLQEEYTPWMKNTLKSKHLLGNGVSDYVNREDVRKALNIPTTIQAWE